MASSVQRESYLGVEAIFASAAMRDLLELVRRVAQTSATVLITGESGSGKEIIARAIHHHSPRAGQPWVDINCGALPEHLIESELFGYEKGAFSGAMASKPGLFELADKGSLLLDEIGELDAHLQAKLLRVLDGAPFYRLGGRHKVTVDVRVIAATNQNLTGAIRRGSFRPDLYHRLGQVKLRIPPLRERPEDVLPLAEFFLAQQQPGKWLSPEAERRMREYHWPGNVRELRNAMITSALTALDQQVRAGDLALDPEADWGDFAEAGSGTGTPAAVNLDELEREAIVRALEKTGRHQERAARLLGISSRTLRRKLRLYGLRVGDSIGERYGSISS